MTDYQAKCLTLERLTYYCFSSNLYRVRDGKAQIWTVSGWVESECLAGDVNCFRLVPRSIALRMVKPGRL
jgi:hypothetical protein